MSHIDSIVDMWLALEHNEAFKEKERRVKEEERNQYSNQGDLLAPDMAGVLEKIRRMASIEAENEAE